MAISKTKVDKLTRTYTKLKPKWQSYFPPTTTTTIDKSKSKPITTTTSVYNNQYSILYTNRLESLRDRISKEGLNYISRIIGLVDDGSVCLVIGTVVKQYSMNSLKELEEVDTNVIPLRMDMFENDDAVLEDESGRIELKFSDALKDESDVLATGVVIGVVGSIDATGCFNVEKILYPTLPAPLTPQSTGDKRVIALVSGLNIGNDNSFRRSLLIDYLAGQFSDTSTISRLILAGGNVASQSYAIHELDLFTSELCANGIPVDIIPGRNDPTNANFPFRNFHPCLFPLTPKSLLHLSGNPYKVDIDERCLLGTDGSNILNFMRFTNTTPIQAMEYTLKYNIVAPTAPDTIPAFPYSKGEDPLVMEYAPHVYFIGNCSEYQSKKIDVGDEECRLICIPDFESTGEVVLLDLDTLDCRVVRIVDTL